MILAIRKKVLKRVYCLILLSVSNAYLNAQTLYKGQTLDTENQPVPFVHIQLKGQYTGTISNVDGNFQLLLPVGFPKNPIVIVSSIGYVSREITLTENFNTIRLAEDVTNLGEVVVVPTDRARLLMEEVIKKIPDNYPSTDEKHTGFYRELAYWDSLRTQSVYAVEMVLDSYKKSYAKPVKTGKVKLLEGRRYEDETLDSLKNRFYAGAHDAHNLDFVAKRAGPLSKPDKYDFQLVDTVKNNGKRIFELEYKKKEKVLGKIFIEDSSLAIIRYESLAFYPESDRIYRDYTVDYTSNEGIWRLSNIAYNTAFGLAYGRIYLYTEYVSTDVSEEIEKLPYLEQFQYQDVVLDNTGAYDSTFWNNYNIIAPEKGVEELFASQKQLPQDQEAPTYEGINRRLEIFSRLRSSFSINAAFVTVAEQKITYQNDAFTVDEALKEKLQPAIFIATAVQYEIRDDLYIGFRSTIPITTTVINAFDLELIREFNLNKKGRPISFSPGFSFGYLATSKKLRDVSAEGNFSVRGTEFDSGEANLFLQQRAFRIKPTLSVGVEISRKIQLALTSGLNINLAEATGLYFDESDQFFLKQKARFLRNGNESLNISNNQPLLNRWNAAFQVFWRF
ncbi:MAG: carboxypeptidase-like regulatory domain-containing protein [Bacteroidota bacterium]